MSQLATYDLPDILTIEVDKHNVPVYPNPGTLVKHKSDLSSLGTCISRHWGPDDKPMQVTVLWAKPPRTFSNVIFPKVRKTSPTLLANQLVSVQPMTAPAGGIFYMNYTYGSGSNGGKV